ncbi:hypothetical protein HPB48_015735 [Haemaphysalis longicornis]|uniref:Amidase domain-containing protein n=1 Tax=Haemaphysalis longicornis TaxID=44386 RepID=A0A9J6H489_HAELO|nr:hypothetical protein HPB48_015735 [Haemaphysalis longicornis]
MALDAGLCSRRGAVAERDSDAVAALRSAGAIPLAVTNVSEMAMWWESSNKLHGRTRNPYDLRRTPGGSSGTSLLVSRTAHRGRAAFVRPLGVAETEMVCLGDQACVSFVAQRVCKCSADSHHKEKKADKSTLLILLHR